MTYRERREKRAEQRRDWAASRSSKADAAHERVHAISDMIPFGQPVLVGHHSEGRHRRDLGRIESGMRESVESSRMATRHEQAADEIERQLRTSVYDDDADAVERLQEKLAGLEAKREQRKAANAAYRKEHKAELKTMSAYERSQAVPFPSYSISNLTGVITTTRKRIERLEREKTAGVSYRMMAARYGGQCDRCGAAVEKGDTMFYNRRAAERMLCDACGKG